jgi:hypothetical protein
MIRGGKGPIEDRPNVPTELIGRVTTPGAHPRLHGYDVEGELAAHATFAHVVLLALTGELPDDPVARGFDVALKFLAPVSVADAPGHAAVLATLTGAQPTAVVAMAAITLAEEARAWVDAPVELLAWLLAPDVALPASVCAAARPDDADAVARLVAALAATGLEDNVLRRVLSAQPTRDAALVALLWTCGLRSPGTVAAARVIARLACAVAEGFASACGKLSEYPIGLPPFQYEVDDERR